MRYTRSDETEPGCVSETELDGNARIRAIRLLWHGELVGEWQFDAQGQSTGAEIDHRREAYQRHWGKRDTHEPYS